MGRREAPQVSARSPAQRARTRGPRAYARGEAYAEAERLAHRKLGFVSHLVPYLATCTFLLFVAGPRAAMIVAMAWGIGVASDGSALSRRPCASVGSSRKYITV